MADDVDDADEWPWLPAWPPLVLPAERCVLDLWSGMRGRMDSVTVEFKQGSSSGRATRGAALVTPEVDFLGLENDTAGCYNINSLAVKEFHMMSIRDQKIAIASYRKITSFYESVPL